MTAFERDALGRIVAEVQDGARIAYELDPRGRVVTRTLPDEAESQTTHYAYDRLGACTQVIHEGPFGKHTVDFERDTLGRESRRRSTTTTSTPLDMVRSYDAMGRLLEQQVTVPSPGGSAPRALSGRRWHYDRAGRPTAIDDQRWGTTHYRYDPLGQLLEAKRGPHHEVFDYDVTGSLRNILTEAGATPGGWRIEPGNVLVEKNGTSYSNDLCKRRTRKVEPQPDGSEAVTAYRWDVRDRLREVRLPDGRRAVYRYDAFARRVSKEVHPASSLREDLARAVTGKGSALEPERTRFLYHGDVLCAELRGEQQGGVRVHVHEAGSFAPLLQVERGEVLTVVNDHLGMPKELVDGRGRVAWAAAHSAWGRLVEVRRDEGAAQVTSFFRLLGQYADDETGLCYTWFRYFDAEAGRWCSPDPLGIVGGLNLGAFDRSPSASVDPFGLSGCKGVRETQGRTFIDWKDADDPRFFFTVELGDDGIMRVNARTRLDGDRSTNIKGGDFFDRAIDHFGRENIKGIEGKWHFGTNLDHFNKATGRGESGESAALGTWTGGKAQEHGFGKAVVHDDRTEGTPGNYSKVEVTFLPS